MRIISRWTLDLGWVLEHEFFPLAGGSWLYHPAKECVVWKMFFAAFDCPRTGWEGHVWHTPPIILERNCFADLAHWLGWQFVARIFFLCGLCLAQEYTTNAIFWVGAYVVSKLAMMIWPDLGLIGYWNGLALVWSMSIHTVEPRKPRLPGTGIVLVIFGLRQVMVGILIRKHMEATSINQSIPRQSSPMWYWYHYQSMSHYHYHQSMVPV